MILVLGGGVAGLAAAHFLARRLPQTPRLVLERESEPGGLCRSRRVGEFTFDFTGHYLHLRDPGVMQLAEELLGAELTFVERRSFVFTQGVRLDFPFQANLHGLPPEVVARCLLDFVAASARSVPGDGTMTFDAWARRVFGDGIAECFLLPYNSKLFGLAPNEFTAEWATWSAPRPDLAQVVRGALGLRNTDLGYNPRFWYPRRGGIGALAGALAARVGPDLHCGAEVIEVDLAKRTVTLANGGTLPWERLISTAPLPALLRLARGGEDPERRADIASRLRWRAVLDLQLGVDRANIADGAHWIYFPDADAPFYRAGIPSNVAPALAPAGCSSVSVEFSHPAGAPAPGVDNLIAAARPALERAGLLRAGDRIVAADCAVLDPAYVIFDPQRTPLVDEALARLERAGVHSIGRFGAWTYSYIERAILDARAAVDRIAETGA